jgi:hypothetical protein
MQDEVKIHHSFVWGKTILLLLLLPQQQTIIVIVILGAIC